MLTVVLGAACTTTPDPTDTVQAGAQRGDQPESTEPEDARRGGEAQPDDSETRRADDRDASGRTPSPDGDDADSDDSSDPVRPWSNPGARLGLIPERVPRDPVEEAVNRVVAALTLEERVGQMIMPGRPYRVAGGAQLTIDDDLRAMLRETGAGGFILFGANVRDPEQVRRLVEDLQASVPIPLIIAIDQEGGVVRRVVPSERMPATAIPSARQVGRTANERLAYELARVIGRELRSLGVTMNFAPVADVITNPANTVIGSRAFGTTPDLVARMVAAMVRGMQDEGISAVIKHFPGHGDTVVDTHEGVAVVPHSIERLREIELVPFARGIEAGADGVLTAHVVVPAVGDRRRPATLDPAIITGLLRSEFDYNGLVVSDSLVMGAITSEFTPEEAVVAAVEAGVDILLLPANPLAARDAIVAAVDRGQISVERINASVRRILRVKFRRDLMRVRDETESGQLDVTLPGAARYFARPERFVPNEITLGVDEHRLVAEEIERHSAR